LGFLRPIVLICPYPPSQSGPASAAIFKVAFAIKRRLYLAGRSAWLLDRVRCPAVGCGMPNNAAHRNSGENIF
jgi:hypothetical protein